MTSECYTYAIEPLPDFLRDHTLPGREEGARLHEHLARWTQFVRGLHTWRRQAVFAIRFVADRGTTRVFFAARPFPGTAANGFRVSVEALLRTHRLVRSTEDAALPGTEFTRVSQLNRPVFCNLAQHYTQELWKPRHLERFFSAYDQADVPPLRTPLVVCPWRGPGGPFLLPLEALAAQSVKTSLTIYLEPTELTDSERQWLAVMAAAGQSLGEQNEVALGQAASARRVDAAAALAGRLYGAHLRRLSVAPFLCFIQIGAAAQDIDATRNMASALEAVSHETSSVEEDIDAGRLPTGVRTFHSDTSEEQAASLQCYTHLSPHSLIPATTANRTICLADAAGAATMFRMPVSVRGGVPGVRVRQLPPDFRPGPREDRPPADTPSLNLGRFEGGGNAYIPVRDLTRHALITGFTGSGKTFTLLRLLHQLWVDHKVPFLVLESAKQEYRGLLDVEGFRDSQLRIYTSGNETCSPLRLNPFQLLPGVRVEAHLSRLQVCFEAAIPPVGPSSSIISEALHRVYEIHGWELTDSCPFDGIPKRTFPTLRAFVDVVEKIVTQRGYSGEVLGNLQAALLGRFRPLLLGGKGRMFDTQLCDPMPAALFGSPTIVELNDLNLDEKALVTLFLLTLLREHREQNRAAGGALAHVAVVEEAHNVLGAVRSEGGSESAVADTRFKAVETFCSLLTEIRALGQGLIIADQSPEKLAGDAIRNTNLQIVHQLRDVRDRNAMAGAMLMDDDQRDFMGKLEVGSAALFYTGMEKATFVTVPPFADEEGAPGNGFQAQVSNDEVRQRMSRLSAVLAAREGSGHCSDSQRCRDNVFPLVSQAEARRHGVEWFASLDPSRQATGTEPLRAAVRFAMRELGKSSLPVNEQTVWCHVLLTWQLAADANGFDRNKVKLSEQHYREVICHLRHERAKSMVS